MDTEIGDQGRADAFTTVPSHLSQEMEFIFIAELNNSHKQSQATQSIYPELTGTKFRCISLLPPLFTSREPLSGHPNLDHQTIKLSALFPTPSRGSLRLPVMEILPIGITRGDGPVHGLRLLDPWRRGVGDGGRKTPILDLVPLAALHAPGAVDEDTAADEGEDDHQGYDTDNDLDCCADEAHLAFDPLDSLVTRISRNEFRDRCLEGRQISLRYTNKSQ